MGKTHLLAVKFALIYGFLYYVWQCAFLLLYRWFLSAVVEIDILAYAGYEQFCVNQPITLLLELIECFWLEKEQENPVQHWLNLQTGN